MARKSRIAFLMIRQAAKATAWHMQAVNSITIYKQSISGYPIYDVDALTKLKDTLEKHYDILNNLYFPEIPKLPDMTPVHILDMYFPEIPELPDMTKVHIMDIYFPTIPELPDMTKVNILDIYYPSNLELTMPWFIDIDCNILPVEDMITELKELKAGRCPTCGKPWVD